MTYVDGFVLPVPKDKIDAYRKMAQKAGKIWMEHGALHYCECVGEDLNINKPSAPFKVVEFPKLAKAKENETVVFAFIIFKSRAHRDKVNAKVMKDKRMNENMPSEKDMPFDCKRMGYGGFKTIVDL